MLEHNTLSKNRPLAVFCFLVYDTYRARYHTRKEGEFLMPDDGYKPDPETTVLRGEAPHGAAFALIGVVVLSIILGLALWPLLEMVVHWVTK